MIAMHYRLLFLRRLMALRRRTGRLDLLRNVQKAYAKKVYVDRAFQKKTNELVQRHIDADRIASATGFVKIDADTVRLIKNQAGGDATKVINLVKSIEKIAEENSEDPFLVALGERAKAVQENYEDRQTATSEALDELLKAIKSDEERKREQAARGLDGLSYFVLCKLTDEGVSNAEVVTKKVREAFIEFTNWRRSQNELRQLRQKVTFALFAEQDDLDKVTMFVDSLFSVLERTGEIERGH